MGTIDPTPRAVRPRSESVTFKLEYLRSNGPATLMQLDRSGADVRFRPETDIPNHFTDRLSL